MSGGSPLKRNRQVVRLALVVMLLALVAYVLFGHHRTAHHDPGGTRVVQTSANSLSATDSGMTRVRASSAS